MQESSIFDHYDFSRAATIQLLDSVSEEHSDVIPNGYNNSLRWNLGHIPVVQEGVLYYFGMNQTGKIPTNIQEAFKPGSSPKDWTVPPLTLSELRELLLEQRERIKETFSGKLGEPAANVFDLGEKKIKTVEGLFIFTHWHEGLHQGIIKSMKRALN